MARTLFGGSSADVAVKKVADADAVGGFVLAPDSTTVWEVMTTRTGGIQLTDLQDLSGATITTVVGDATDGSIAFFGPDPYTGEVWLRNQASPSSKRWRVGSTASAGGGVGTVTSVASVSPDGAGNVPLTKTDIGLGNVTNTSDANKPVSTAQATAIALKADATALDAYALDGHTHVIADITDVDLTAFAPLQHSMLIIRYTTTPPNRSVATSDPNTPVWWQGLVSPIKSGTGSTGAVTADAYSFVAI